MSKTKILIVDDHRVVIEGIKGVLCEHPEFEVVGEALNGLEAVKKAEALRPDIVIMDISMPDLSGRDATIKIKKIESGIGIIIFTMHSDKEYVVSLFKAGISSYVLKEDPVSDLILAIHVVKGGGTYFSGSTPSILVRHIKELEEGNGPEDGFQSLTSREGEVFCLLAGGKSIKQAAKKLCISPKTVESHKYNIMAKLNADTITDLTKIAIRKKLIQI